MSDQRDEFEARQSMGTDQGEDGEVAASSFTPSTIPTEVDELPPTSEESRRKAGAGHFAGEVEQPRPDPAES